MFKNKKLVISLAVGLVVVLAAAGYFVATPAMQVGGYKQQLTTAHEKVGEAVEKLIAVQDRDAFVKSEVESSVVRNDVKAGQDAIKDVEAALASHEKQLTGFNALPLLDWNASYKTATQLKAQEQDYIKNARDYVAEMKGVLAYLEEGAKFTDKLLPLQAKSEQLANAASVDDLTKQLDSLANDFKTILADFEKVAVPESVKASHDEGLKSVREIVALYGDLSAAVKAEDTNKIDQLSQKFTTLGDDLTKKSTEWNEVFLKESKLAKLRDALKNLNREINTNVSKL